MISFIISNLATMLIGAVLVSAVLLIIMKMRKDRKNGKTCGCGCDGCPGGSVCRKH